MELKIGMQPLRAYYYYPRGVNISLYLIKLLRGDLMVASTSFSQLIY